MSQEERAAQPEQFQLNFRPEDRFSRPIQGTVTACKNKLLAKVRVTRPASSTGLGEASKVELVELVGPVKKVVRFRRMSPFQFDVKVPEELGSLPEALQTFDSETINRIAEQLVNPEADTNWDFMALPAPITTHFDYPNNILGPEASFSVRSARPRNAADIKARLPWLVSFNDTELPRVPCAEALSCMVNMNPTMVSKLKAVFEERPVLTRIYANSKVPEISYTDLAKILPVFAFCLVDGPWRNCWLKYGVDPRSDPRYRMYQVVQCRNNLISESLEPAEHGTEDVPEYQFYGTTAGTHFGSYQFIDIHYKPLTDLVQSATPVTACMKQDGWFPKGFVNNVRRIIRRRWLDVMREKDPEALSRHNEAVQSARERKQKQSQQSHSTTDLVDEDGDEDGDEDEEDDDYEYYDEE